MQYQGPEKVLFMAVYQEPLEVILAAGIEARIIMVERLAATLMPTVSMVSAIGK